MVKNGDFREDLYYRLNVLELRLPPLRARSDDIPLLLRQMIPQYNKRLKTHISGISPELETALKAYGWPGNIRQLGNILEQMMVLSERNELDVSLLREISSSLPLRAEKKKSKKEQEQKLILETLRKTGGNKKEAARLLEMNPSTLWRKLKAMNCKQ
jgi:DNA-binding NtrC family response regulator